MNGTDLLLSMDAAASAPSILPNILLFGGIAVLFYFVVIRPQQTEAKDHQSLVNSLVKGDRVVTVAGIHATIAEAQGDTLVLELSKGTFMTVDRDTIKRKVAAPPAGAS